jgi:hypothetical protein
MAGTAIKRHNEAVHQGDDAGCTPEDRPVRGRVLEWPVSTN